MVSRAVKTFKTSVKKSVAKSTATVKHKLKAKNPTRKITPATMANTGGYTSWKRPIKELAVQTLVTNTLGNTYYASSKELLEMSHRVHDDAIKNDPTFFAKAIVYARNDGYMRTQPILGLAKLSLNHPDLFKKIFDKIILTPNDFADFMQISTSLRNEETREKSPEGAGDNKPFFSGRTIKTAGANWLNKHFGSTSDHAEYWVIKYGSDSKDSFTLKDMLKIFHPDNIRGPIANYILGKGVKNLKRDLPQIYQFDRMKSADTATDKADAIKEGRLPHEVASSVAGDSKTVWKAIAPNMPNFALLRNLATLERHGVINDFQDLIEKRFNDAEGIKRSKILPFRFLDAMEKVNEGWAKDALRGAIDNSIENIPNFIGDSCVMLDISGSMSTFMKTAALFGVAATRKSPNGKLLLFDTRTEEFAVSKRDSVLTQADKIHPRGGTDTSSPIKHLMNANKKFDNLIMITDEQQNTGTPMFKVYNQYRNTINPKAKLFIIDVSPYTPNSGAMAPEVDDVFFIYGWNDQVLNFISQVTRGWENQVEAIQHSAL